MMEQSEFDWIFDGPAPKAGLSPTLMDPDKNDLGEQKKARFEQDTKFRKHFSCWVMAIVPSWLFLTMALMFFTGFGLTSFSEGAIIALLTTTTANVLGLAFIVLKGMFPEGNIKDNVSD